MRLHALTGTPGTGKTTVAALLPEHFVVLTAAALAEACDAFVEDDTTRGARVVDEERLARGARAAAAVLAPGAEEVVVEGLLAHFADPDDVVVLRCHPDALRARLEARGYPPAKVRENVEAEALDAISQEVEVERAWSVETTAAEPPAVAGIIARLFKGERVTGPEVHPLGGLDWSETLLGGDPS